MDIESINSLNGFTTTIPVTVAKAGGNQAEKGSAVGGKAPAKTEVAVFSKELHKEVEEAPRRIDREDLDKTTKLLDKIILEANKKLFGSPSNLMYSVHKKTKEIMIKIIDSETKEVIKEIPPEKTLDAVAKMWELAGILVDEIR